LLPNETRDGDLLASNNSRISISGKSMGTGRRLSLARGAGPSAALAILLVGCGHPSPQEADPVETVRLLDAVLAEQRIVTPRLATTDTHVAPQTVRGPVTPNWRILAAVEAAARKVQREPNATTLYVSGLARLLAGDLVDSVRELASATAASASAPIYNDLGAALFTRADRLNRFEDLPEALAAFIRASQLDPTAPAPRFNRALALERMFLYRAAERSWQDVIEQEKTAAWRDEATDRLRRLQAHRFRPTDAASVAPDLLRAKLETTGLAALGSDRLVSWDEATREVQQYEQMTGDRLLSRQVGLLRAESRSARSALATAHRAYATALDFIDRDRLREASEQLQSARRTFASFKSPFVLWCDYRLAVLDYVARDYHAATRRLDQVAAVASLESYRTLSGHAAWTKGLILALRGEVASSVSLFQDAERAFDATAETVLHGRLLNQLADVHETLGDSNTSWRYRVRALEIAARNEDARLRNSVYGSLSAGLLRRGSLPASAEFLDAQLESIAGSGSNVTRLLLEVRRATVRTLLKDLTTASTAVVDAEQLLERLHHDPRFASLRAGVLRARAELHVAKNEMAAAEAAANSAIELVGPNRDYLRTELLTVRARARAAGGDTAGTLADVGELSSLIDRRRSDLAAPVFSAPDEISARALGDDLLAANSPLHLDNVASLRLAETLRRLWTPSTRHLEPQVDPRAIPPDHAIVAYAVLPTQAIVWVIAHGEVRGVRLPVTRSVLEARVARLRMLATRRVDQAEFAKVLTDLHEILLEPLLPLLEGVTHLVVVPDWPLDGVPFAALRSKTGAFLVESRTVMMAPSLATRPATAESASNDVLVVAVPESSVATEEGLSPLRGALREASLIRGAYKTAEVLIGPAAHRTSVLLRLNAARVVHMALHAVADPFDAKSSYLVLGGSERSSSIVTAADLAAVSLDRVRLLVLAACSTGRSDIRPRSSQSLAFHLLAAGAENVVATLWDVDDEASPEFFARFHRSVAKGDAPSSALRQAQRASLAGPGRRDLFFWSSIVTYGWPTWSAQSLSNFSREDLHHASGVH
jgi:CHAT domain-containing protein/tetratricopeptide (TPR) repeat protein